MVIPLNVLRYGLILLPGIASIFIFSYENNGIYTLLLLIVLALSILITRITYSPVSLTLLAIQIGLTTWMCSQFGDLLIFVSLSALLSALSLQNRTLAVLFFTLYMLLLNYFNWDASIHKIAFYNLTVLLTTALLCSQLATVNKYKNAMIHTDELRKRNYDLHEERERLIHFNHQIETAVQTSERTRISRELHDNIGHRLIRIKMMMEAALQLLPKDFERGLSLTLEVRDQLAASMDEMRNTVRRVRPLTSMEETYSLNNLLENIGRETGIHTALHVEGMPFALYPSIQVVLYKNAQEALTNAIRHGKASAVEVKLIYSSDELIMSIQNNGYEATENDQSMVRQGMGLSGMKERTGIVGGRVDINRSYPFTVTTTIPVLRRHEIN